jgi:hypothetical protein
LVFVLEETAAAGFEIAADVEESKIAIVGFVGDGIVAGVMTPAVLSSP